VVKDIKVGMGPAGVAVNPSTNMIYVANTFSNSTSVIDGKTSAVVKTIRVGIGPEAVAVDALRNVVYVTNEDSKTVSVIDGKTNNVMKNIKIENTGASIVKLGLY
jgi:YVTN family beta-propeller protein